ncbi:MAG: hypothetical protein K0R33_836 [Mycobacterium sp.]|nr:hypothetical protein [Mycobacterium sp.]
MVEERSLNDLILEPGRRAVAFGRLEAAADQTYALWVVPAYNPQASCRVAGGVVPVMPMQRAGEVPSSTVNVTGTWTGEWLVDASVTEGPRPLAKPWLGEPGAVAMSQLGLERHRELSDRLVSASVEPVLGIGGSDDGIVLHVLYVTPSLVEACRNLPVRADIYAAITPLQ